MEIGEEVLGDAMGLRDSEVTSVSFSNSLNVEECFSTEMNDEAGDIRLAVEIENDLRSVKTGERPLSGSIKFGEDGEEATDCIGSNFNCANKFLQLSKM